VAEVARRENLAAEGAGRLEVFQTETLQIIPGGQPFDPVGVALVRALIVPDPMFATVGKNDEGGLEVLSVAAGLLLGVVGVPVFALGFENAPFVASGIFDAILTLPRVYAGFWVKIQLGRITPDRAKPAYPLTIAIIGTASRRMVVAMAKTMKYAG
jgi:hypothetical protein